jgi:hypothetical protein
MPLASCRRPNVKECSTRLAAGRQAQCARAKVKAGDIVVSLDDTQIRVSRDIVVKALNELAARQAREEAERDGLDKVTFSADLIARKNDPDVDKAVTGEQRQFEIRRTSREGSKAQLRERMIQLRQEINGYEALITSKDKQVEWVGRSSSASTSCGKRSHPLHSHHQSRAREGAAGRRARPAHRLHRSIEGKDCRD